MTVVSQIYNFPREDTVIIMISNVGSQCIRKTNTIVYDAMQAQGMEAAQMTF
jgi:ATP-dependent Clp protease ATP-binding subunit ClpA